MRVSSSITKMYSFCLILLFFCCPVESAHYGHFSHFDLFLCSSSIVYVCGVANSQPSSIERRISHSEEASLQRITLMCRGRSVWVLRKFEQLGSGMQCRSCMQQRLPPNYSLYSSMLICLPSRFAARRASNFAFISASMRSVSLRMASTSSSCFLRSFIIESITFLR